ncbi:MAG TPA: tRNA (adenosine(37)-N6)-threonylcarbamoyltransferase complex dimerization subunit type 1 TsaB, partial [Candidatus Onthovivens sp.]|nr:tRNA (adenosine(37)-N6)-threonylcarbamoyltransferase complex dimerization subunit type 1 TsaB [Candidatus Onthovivens sp.]
SNKLLLVALAKNDLIIDEIKYEAWQKQSELMILEIDNLLKRNKLEAKEISKIITTIGPGSYTGVRIALTIAKIYGYALKIPIFALSSLQILKVNRKPTICLLNARSNRSYIGVYLDNEVLLKDQVYSNDEVLNYIAEHKDYVISGEVGYLNLESKEIDLAKNMLDLHHLENEVENILALKAVYLKD